MKSKILLIAVAATFSAGAIASDREVVRQAQEKLSAAGHDAGASDGKLGAKTQAALASFQDANGLKATGQLNSETLAALQIGTPEGTTTSSSTGSSSAPANEEAAGTGGTDNPGSSPERTAEPREQPK
jgi:peptidoglycan hydrolase-like protein with peptidoglycan-binding domain